MLERELELEGGLLCCDLGGLPLREGQTVECSLLLEGVLPERRVAVAAELLEEGESRGVRMAEVPPHHAGTPRDILLTGLRFYLPQGGRTRPVTIRADAHYIDRCGRCALPGPETVSFDMR